MKFSIIVPVYNAEKYIKESLETVLQQTNQDFEIILVDDGSTDLSGKICDEYAENYPKKIRVIHQKNQGQLLTRCNGIKCAKGEYIVFLDADDTLISNGLELLSNAIMKYENPDMIIYSFWYDNLLGKKEQAKLLFEEETVFVGEGEKKELYQKFFSTTLLNNVWTKVVKRTVFDGEFPNYDKYKKLRCSEDRLYSMGMISNAEKIVYIKEPIYEYKLIPNSVSRTFNVEAIEKFNVRILYEEELKYLNKWELQLPEYKDRMDANWILQVWYVLDMFYKNAVTKVQRKQILDYEWQEFVPVELRYQFENNPYLSEQQKKCWKWIVEKQLGTLIRYFWKKKLYFKLRDMKRVVTGK